MAEGVIITEYDAAWPEIFGDVARRLRGELGPVALRIDHIGSTAVAGLAAKPIIDLQISVESFEPLDSFRVPIERAGFVHREDNPERTKRYFRERAGQRRTHVHVRRAGSFSEQFAPLFRDYLRAHPERAADYAALKYRLAAEFSAPAQRQHYVEAKGPFIWDTIRLADEWAQATGWQPADSDC